MTANLTPYQSSDEKMSTRRAFGDVMIEVARKNDRVVAMTADLILSVNLIEFKDEFPDRFYNFGVAEQNMVAGAAGMAMSGLVPFVATFASFLSLRACEQIRNDCAYSYTNVKLVGANAGISGGPAGPTHHAIEDLAIFRAFPGMTILTPADAHEVTAAVELMADYEGPMYLRLGRDPWPMLHAGVEGVDYRIGGSECFRNGDDAAIFAIGNMVAEAIEASEKLSQEGIGARVVSLFSLKPIDREVILDAARETQAIVTVEDHNVLGGLGSAVAEIAVQAGVPLAFQALGSPDQYAPVGPAHALYSRYGCDASGIAETVRDVISRLSG
jgi:transketolase